MTILYKHFHPTRFEAAYRADGPEHGMRLDRFIQKFVGTGFSREAIKRKIKLGHVAIEGRPGTHRPNSRVHKKNIVRFTIQKTTHEEEYWNGHRLSLDPPRLLYENEDLFALFKPPYMSTHPTGRHLFHCATVYLQNLTGQKVHPLHRLDRETSGVLLLAKNVSAANRMGLLFEEEKVKKIYLFMGVKTKHFRGKFPLRACERIGPSGQFSRRAYAPDAREGQRAETTFHLLKEVKGRDGQSYFLGLAFPHTGRQHQIRLHASHHGFPLLGDKLYFGDDLLFQRFKTLKAAQEDHDHLQWPRHALHALGIALPSETGSPFLCPLPDDFKRWIHEQCSFSPDKFERILHRKLTPYLT